MLRQNRRQQKSAGGESEVKDGGVTSFKIKKTG